MTGKQRHAYAWYRSASVYLSRGNARMAHEMIRQGDRALDSQAEVPEAFRAKSAEETKNE